MARYSVSAIAFPCWLSQIIIFNVQLVEQVAELCFFACRSSTASW